MKIAWILLAGVLPLAVAADEAAVRCAEIGFSQSAERRDAEAFAQFVDREARFVTSRVSRGRDEVVAAWAPFLGDGGASIAWRPDVVEVAPSGDLALSRGPYRIRGTDEAGNPTETWGHFISTWRRGADGRWRVLFDSGGDHGMTPTDAERALMDAPTNCAN